MKAAENGTKRGMLQSRERKIVLFMHDIPANDLNACDSQLLAKTPTRKRTSCSNSRRCLSAAERDQCVVGAETWTERACMKVVRS